MEKVILMGAVKKTKRMVRYEALEDEDSVPVRDVYVDQAFLDGKTPNIEMTIRTV